ncbi:MAG: lipase maturation factor family protein [Leucobacter sp.]
MEGFAAVDFWVAREVLQRGIAALFLVAFLSTLNQFPALLGERGLLPAPRFLEFMTATRARRAELRPTLFRWLRYTDRRLAVLCWIGIAVSALLLAGIPQLGGPWLPMLAFLTLWLSYMSVVSIGQTFYGFGWEMLLLEAGFLAAFLGSRDQPPPTVVIVLFWWLLFRLEFGAGLIKIRGGREWRDLTALTFHHETQPMPGPLSRQAHLMPRWFHCAEVIGNHVAQLAVPFLLFAPIVGLWVDSPIPGVVGTVAAAIVIGTQLWLVCTGNFAWLNWATIVLAASAVSVPGVTLWGDPSAGAGLVVDGLPLWWLLLTSAVALLIAGLSWPALRNLASRRQLMNASFNRWQLANAYGAFGTVTRTRVEYVIEGSAVPGPAESDWREYEFKGKPGDVRRVPGQFAPYHLRLDWLMWFLPLGHSLENWFTTLLVRLLEADGPTLALLRRDPFAGERPQLVRVVTYRYRFTTRAERRDTGAVWVRDQRTILVPPVQLPGE